MAHNSHTPKNQIYQNSHTHFAQRKCDYFGILRCIILNFFYFVILTSRDKFFILLKPTRKIRNDLLVFHKAANFATVF